MHAEPTRLSDSIHLIFELKMMKLNTAIVNGFALSMFCF